MAATIAAVFGFGVFHQQFDRTSEQTAPGVDFVGGHLRACENEPPGARERASQRHRYADLDGIAGLRLRERGDRAQGERPDELADVANLHCLLPVWLF